MAQNQAQHDAERSEEAAAAPEPLQLDEDGQRTRTLIFDALAQHEVATVTAEYHGSGDEGSIEDIWTDGGPPLNHITVFVPLEEEGEPHVRSLRNVIEDFVWDELVCGSEWDGFWNGDGGSGTVTFNVAARTITWDHEETIVTSQTHSYEA